MAYYVISSWPMRAWQQGNVRAEGWYSESKSGGEAIPFLPWLNATHQSGLTLLRCLPVSGYNRHVNTVDTM